MYKLLLVDDEEDVREGVIREIDWASLGFEVVGTVENGQEAWEFVERCPPDLVVTDIRMPFMDGLALSEEIKKRFPYTKIVILTGYDEFAYAQKAIKLQIDEFVLKPFSSRELVDALTKVKAKMDEEIAEKKNLERLKAHYRNSLPVLREAFLVSLITRRLPRSEIWEKARSYGIDLEADGYVVSVISLDHGASPPGEASETDPAADPARGWEEQALPLFAVQQIAREIAESRYPDTPGIVSIHNDQVVLITVHRQDDPHPAMAKAVSLLEEVRQSVEKFMHFTVTAGVGTTAADVTDIPFSYEGAVLALDYRVMLGRNRVICIDDVERRSIESVRFDELKEQALVRCIKVGTLAELKSLVDELFAGLTDAPVSIQDYQIYLMEILTTILKVAKRANLDLETIVGEHFHLFAEVSRLHTVQEAKDWIVAICTRIMQNITSDRQHAHRQLVERAVEYVHGRYHESDLSINKVSAMLHISAGYFSSIFKKEMKMTFGNYLLQVRMEAAKELLRTTDLKAFEVAERVGYADPNYFSFSFRKMFGISPKEYRNGARGM